MNDVKKATPSKGEEKIPDILANFGQWYRAHDEDKASLLPQNLTAELLDEAIVEAHRALKEKDCDTPFLRMVVGLLKVNKQRVFQVAREEVYAGMHAYALNLILEGLRRSGAVTIAVDFSVENVLLSDFERHIELKSFEGQASGNREVG